MGYAFISYSSINQASADAIRKLFSKNDIDTWMAPYDVPVGSKYAAVITKAIRDCSCFVLLLSNDSQASEAVDSEVELAALTFKKSIITIELEKVILNDAFTFYIHNKQIIALHKIVEDSNEIKQVLEVVGAYTKENSLASDAQATVSKSIRVKEEASMIKAVDGKKILDNRYELQNKIGEGWNGVVYKAEDLKNFRTVAVKIDNRKSDDIKVYQKLKEMYNMHLSQIYTAEINSDGETYIVMDYFSAGRTLSNFKDYQDFSRQVNDDFLVNWHLNVLIDVLDGLKCLHDNNIIHADIHPANIMTNGFGTKLIDFGSAYFVSDGPDASRMRTVPICGEDYDCPDRLSKRDFRSDLYSVGMVAFKWLTGCCPMKDDSGRLILDDVKAEPELLNILSKATAFNPDNRYQTAEEFIAALSGYAEDQLRILTDVKNNDEASADDCIPCPENGIQVEDGEKQSSTETQCATDDELKQLRSMFLVDDACISIDENDLLSAIDGNKYKVHRFQGDINDFEKYAKNYLSFVLKGAKSVVYNIYASCVNTFTQAEGFLVKVIDNNACIYIGCVESQQLNQNELKVDILASK